MLYTSILHQHKQHRIGIHSEIRITAALSQSIRAVMHFDTCDDLMEMAEQAAECKS